MLGDAAISVRSGAAVALGQPQDTRAVDPLIKTLSDAEVSVRTVVALSFGELGDARAIGPLEELLVKEKDPSVRQQIEYALKRLREAPAGKP